ncbi:hypothetical protein [Sphingomonas sp. Leaf357]|uniref:hypothetical protein n=1 Tax=Sphingomonas sp. Leaf357 TaxID=1736350 RepID=UPI000A4E2986|nr:hypothetical protein [Sphingomonas sp. Leaf357]
MKWLNSLGDLLYEVMSWLIFYPITLWRTVTNPLDAMGYSDRELHDSEDQQFTDTLNPPLFLVLSLLLTQAIDVAVGGGTNPIVAQKAGLAGFISDDTSLLALRLILFSLFPLMMAARALRAKRVKLTRQRLKGPFYAQCYACAPFALFLGIGVSLGHTPLPAARIFGAVLSLGAVCAYLTAETMWFSRHLQQGWVRGCLNALRAFIEAMVVALALAVLFVIP